MKLTYSLIAAALACGLASAQTTAYTTPVGYTTNSIKKAFSASSAKVNFVSLPLVNSASWTGKVTAVAGDVLTLDVGSSSLTAGAFDEISAKYPGTTVYAYYVETEDGYWAQVKTNAAGSVTVETDAGPQFQVNDIVTIRRHRTVSDIFGAANEAGLLGDAGGDFNAADNINIIDETNGGNVSLMVSPGLIPNALYIDGSYNDADDYPVYPDQGLQVVRRAESDISLVVSGEVHNRPTQVQVNTGFQIRPVILPTTVALKDLGLYTGNVTTGLAGSDSGDLNQADSLTVVYDGVSTGYFYSTIDLDPAPGDQIGWYDDAYNYVDSAALPAGAALNITRNNPTNSAPFVWVNPAPVIAP